MIRIGLISVVLVVCLVCFVHAVPEDYLSPVDLIAGKDGKTLYIVGHTAKKLLAYDIAGKKVIKTCALEGQPSGVELSPDGSVLYVTSAEVEGRVYVVSVKKFEVTDTLPAGHTPMAPTVSLDGNTLYVCNRFNNNISIIDIKSKKETARVPVTREPVAMVSSLDGKFLFVANHLPTGAANVDHMTSVIDIIDTAARNVCASISLPNGAIDLRALCLSSDGKYVFAPSILARFLVPTTQIERGWINTHALNIIDVEKKQLLWTVLLDDVDLGAANPWGIGCTSDDKYICVAHSATHEVSIIDRAALLEKLAPLPVRDVTSDKVRDKYESSSKNPANDLSFLTGIRRRVKLQGNSPRGLVVVGDSVFSTEYLSDSLAIVSLNPDSPNVQSVELARKKEPDIVRLGEIYFNDAMLCFQQWQSCMTCHPDARPDAVNWDLLNDGIGNPKSTKNLLFAHATPPVMITGIRDKAETAVRAGIRFIQFAVPEEEKACAIDEYLKSLRPVPSPYLVKGKLSSLATKGEKIFEKAGCGSCHSGAYFTDMEKYNVGTGDGMEKDREFDTPMLREVWRTAPYLYDGRAAAMKDVFTKFNKGDNHGTTSKLKEDDLNALIEYVMSL